MCLCVFIPTYVGAMYFMKGGVCVREMESGVCVCVYSYVRTLVRCVCVSKGGVCVRVVRTSVLAYQYHFLFLCPSPFCRAGDDAADNNAVDPKFMDADKAIVAKV